MSGVTLRIHQRAHDELAALPRNIRSACTDFMTNFRADPTAPGLKFQRLTEHNGHERLYSARVTKDYHALLLYAGGSEYLLVSLRHRQDTSKSLDRISYGVNSVTGGIEYVDMQQVDSQVQEVESEQEKPDCSGSSDPTPLFAHLQDEQLTELGVTPVLLPSIREIRSEAALEALTSVVPQLTQEVLTALYQGHDPEEVLEYITRPQAADEEIDPNDYQAASARPATIASSDDPSVQGALGEDFARWQVFLHPTQRKLVEREYRGPARVSGGPGTGKTIVALHRVRHLAEQRPGRNKNILLTTFTKNLASDLRDRIHELGGPQLLERVDILNVDAVATNILNENNLAKNSILNEKEVEEEWRSLLAEVGENRWTPEFLQDEWSEVILGHAVNSRDEYFQVRRPGRVRLRRPERDAIWQLVERFTKRLDDTNCTTFRQRVERAARLEMSRNASIREKEKAEERNGPNLHVESGSGAFLRHRYRHVVVDEAQDMSPAHWKMLRAMVARGNNDMFIVGDTHQRIYGNQLSLGSLKINIRGRSSRLRLNYRTTHQILGGALSLLQDKTYDDLDDGTESLDGYRSILNGSPPDVHNFDTWENELSAVAEQVRAWLDSGAEPSSIGISAPTNEMVKDLEAELSQAGVRAVVIGKQSISAPKAVRVATMHRYKGLEFQHMCVTGISEKIIPHRVNGTAKEIERQHQLDRSLLFVAATRARDNLCITSHGEPSHFLHSLIARKATS